MRSKFAAITPLMVGLAFGLGTISLTATPTFAKVVEQDDDVFVTRDSATVATDPEQTWLALVAPNTWWSDAHTWSGEADNMYLSPQGGGCFCELLPKADDAAEGIQRGSVQHMVVVQADPGRVLRMRGGLGPLQSEPAEGVLTITLKPVEGGTRILWEYVVGGYTRFEPEVISEGVDGVMSLQLARLVKLLGALDGEEAEEAPDDGAADSTDAAAEEASEVAEDDDDEDASDKRIEPRRVLTLEEAIDQMAGAKDAGDDE